MPQGPIATSVFATTSKTRTGIASNTVVKASAGMIGIVSVLVAGSAGTVHDCAATADATTANQVGVTPAAAAPVTLNFPCLTGIVVKPGASQVIAVTYS